MSDVIARSGHSSNLKRAKLTTATTGTAIVAAAGAGLKIRVITMVVVAGGAVGVSLSSAATAISAVHALAANGGLVLGVNELGWYETAANEALNLTLSGAVSTSIDVTYVVVA